MYLSILFLPLLGSVVSGLLGRKIGVTGSHIITCSSLGLTSVMAAIAFYEVGICGSPVSIYLTSWIDSELMSVSWGFLFDSLTGWLTRDGYLHTAFRQRCLPTTRGGLLVIYDQELESR